MAENLGEALLHLRTTDSGFTSGLNKAERQAESFEKTLSRVGGRVKSIGSTMSTFVTLPIVAAGGAMIKMAVDAEESANKFRVVMGEAASEVEAELRKLTETIPLTISQMREMAGGIQDFLVPMGVARQEAAGMSTEIVKLAGDIASFNNVATDEVIMAIQSALAGSSEPMRRFGVDLRETALKATALEEGLIKAGEEMTTTARAQAILIKTTKDSSDAMGDAARTVDSTQNLMRFLWRDVKQLAETLGNDLVPIIRPWLKELREWTQRFSELEPATRKIIIQVGLLAAAVGPLLVVVGTLAIAIGAISVPVAIAVGALAVLGVAAFQLVEHWDYLKEQTRAVWQSIVDFLKSALDAFVGFIQDAINGVIKAFNWLSRQLAKIPGITHQAVEEFKFLKKESVDLGAALGGVNEEAGKGALSFVKIKRTTGDAKKAFNSLGMDLGKLTKATDSNTKATDDNTDSKKDNAAATADAKSEAELFIEAIQDQEKRLRQQIKAIELAESTTLDYDAALLFVEATSLGVAEATREARDRIQEFREELDRIEKRKDVLKEIREIVESRNEFVASVFRGEFLEAMVPDDETAEALGETFGESLTKGMLDEVRNSLARAFRGDFKNFFSNLARGLGDIFAQVLANSITKGFVNDTTGAFDLAGGISNIGNLFSKGFGGLKSAGSSFGNLLSGTGGFLSNIKNIGKGLFDAIPVIGSVIGAGFALFDVIGGLFKDRPRFDVEVFNIGNEREIAENLANGIRFTVSDVIRLGFDEAFRKENIFVKGKGGAEDLAAAKQIREQVANALTNTVDRIFGIINQLPTDMATMLRETFRSTELVFDQLVDDASLEFDEGSSKMEDIQKRWQQFINADLPARFLTTIGDFFTTTIEGLGVSSEAAQSFVNDRLEEIKNTESRELRGQLGEEFLQDFNRFIQAFNFAEGNFGGAVEQSINTLRTLAESIKGLSGEGLPTLETLRLLTQELLRTGDVSQETLDKILQLRSGMVELSFSIAQSINSLTQTINDLGGSASLTSDALRTSIETLTGMAESEALSLEERQRAIEIASGQIDQLIRQAQEQQRRAQERMIERSRQELQARIDVLRESESALQNQLRIAQDLNSLVEDIERNIQDLLLGPQSIETPFQQLGRARQEIENMMSALSGASGSRRAQIGRNVQELLNSLLDIGGRAFQSPSLGFRSIFRETINGLEDLKDEVGPLRSVEEINAEIESIQLRIEALQQQSNSLQETSNNINAMIPPELKALRQRLQVQAEAILERRLSQLAELGFAEGNIQMNQLTVLEQIRNILATADKGTGGPLTGGIPTSGTVPGGNSSQNSNGIFSFQSLSGFAGGGFGDFGRGTPVMLHGREWIFNEAQMERFANSMNKGSGGNTVYINIDNVNSKDKLKELEDVLNRVLNDSPKIRRTVGRIKTN